MVVVVRSMLCLLLWLIALPTSAFHAQVNHYDNKQPQHTLQYLYYQITPVNLKADILVSDPEQHYAFQLTEKHPQIFLAEDQAVWFFARIKNPSAEPVRTILNYNFPLANKIEIYQSDRHSQQIRLLSKGGTDYPYPAKGILAHSYAVELTLAAEQETDIYLRVHDTALLSNHILLWQPDSFQQSQFKQILSDGLLYGTLLLLVFYNLLLYYRTKARFWLYFGVVYLCLALVLSILSGLAFVLLWPDNPEINHAILYIAAGIGFLCLQSFMLSALKNGFTPFWRTLCLGVVALALLLLFSPLYSDSQNRLYILLGVSFISLIADMLISLRFSINSNKSILSLARCCLLLVLSITALVAEQLHYLTGITGLYYVAIPLLLATLVMNFRAASPLPPSPQLTQSETSPQLQQYYDIFHNAVEGLFTSSVNGRLINANKALLDILGYQTLEELKTATAETGMYRFYAEQSDRKKMLEQLQYNGNKSFEFRGVKADNSFFWAMMSARLSYTENPNEAVIHGSLVDITDKKLAYEQLAYLANHDPLTALYNRYHFEQQVQKACDNIRKTSYSLLYIDIDQFRLVNDSCTHHAGDALLKQLSEHLKRTIGRNAIVARLDGDSFGILLPGKNASEAFAIAFNILDSMKEFRFIWQDSIFDINISIGLTELSEQDLSADTVIKKGDAACVIAKEKGRNRIHRFDESDKETQRHQAEIQWTGQLRLAIQNDQFVLFQQPLKALINAEGYYYELLVRMTDKDNNLIAPGCFIGSAERYGLMPHIDRWVIRHYFSWLQQRPEHLQQLALCFINLSGTSLTDPTFRQDIQHYFTLYNIPHQYICFEITESAAILNLQNTLDFIEHFRQQGCKFALDDFGSGFSSYGYLKHFPADFVKIDGNFVRDMVDDPYDKAIVKSIHEVTKAMGMQTIAEYVENNEILQALSAMEVDFVQGYAIARPQPLGTAYSN